MTSDLAASNVLETVSFTDYKFRFVPLSNWKFCNMILDDLFSNKETEVALLK
jgi:hypothetical protein